MKTTSFLKTVLAALVLTASASLLQAQATRTWVSGVGDDANPCSRTAPCKTFAGAISKTAEGGEIDVLDPGGFGAVTITKALTIDGTHGAGFGSILNAGTNGVNVNITTGTHINDAVVILRSLSIQGASQSTSGGATLSGINYLKGNRLYVNDCHIMNQNTAGINVSLTTAGSLYVSETDFTNTNVGIKATSTVANVFVDASNISVHGNTNGVQFLSNIQGMITESNFFKNTGEAVGVGATCTADVTHSHFRGNNIALSAAAGAHVRVNENEIFDNANGFQGSAAAFESGGNNKLAGNTANVSPTGPALLNQ